MDAHFKERKTTTTKKHLKFLNGICHHTFVLPREIHCYSLYKNWSREIETCVNIKNKNNKLKFFTSCVLVDYESWFSRPDPDKYCSVFRPLSMLSLYDVQCYYISDSSILTASMAMIAVVCINNNTWWSGFLRIALSVISGSTLALGCIELFLSWWEQQLPTFKITAAF